MTATTERPIGIGRTAEVFAHGEHEVVKVLRPEIPEVVGEHEAAIASLVNRSGVAAPRFLGTTRIDGRLGLVYERVDGPSMLERLGRRPLELNRLAGQCATLHAKMHDADGTGLVAQREAMRTMIDRAGDRIPELARSVALERLAALPQAHAICHGDMHPGNVLMTSGGPVVIDWMTATCGSPAADVTRTLFLLRESGVPGYLPRMQRTLVTAARRAFAISYLQAYRRVRPIEDDELRPWRLPILAARLGEGIEEERLSLLAAIERELDPQARPGANRSA